MSDEVEGIRGEYRKPTPDEIGQIVRLLRKQRGIKRATLALDANVSEKKRPPPQPGRLGRNCG